MSPHSVSILVKSAILFFFLSPAELLFTRKNSYGCLIGVIRKATGDKTTRWKETLFCGEYFKTKTWTNLFSLSLVYFLGFWTWKPVGGNPSTERRECSSEILKRKISLRVTKYLLSGCGLKFFTQSTNFETRYQFRDDIKNKLVFK